MLFIAARWRDWPTLLLLVLAAVFCGCSPDAFLSADEDRDRNFQKARDAVRLGDFDGAAEYYERALERNPRSAVVHLSYASLCEGPLNRYAAAVYHYQRYLRLRPDDPRAEDIRRRVTNCTQRLATMVPLVIRSETIARDLEAVRRENQMLRAQVTSLLTQVGYWSNEVRRVALIADRAADQPLSPHRDEDLFGNPPDRSAAQDPPGSVRSLEAGSRSRAARTHRIVAGDTLHRISRQYGVTVQGLREANPGINERRLLPGKYLRIPER
jgi:tetratricopeptide (TPR) repeat protein